jgi:hypothetical protein
MNKFSLIILIIILLIGVKVIYYNLYQKQNIMDITDTPTTFTLDFFAGGSITGNTFKLHISNKYFTYEEFAPGNPTPVNKMERELSETEQNEIIKTVIASEILNLESQNFEEEPRIIDQGRYEISVTLNGQSNTIQCAIPPPIGTQPKTARCQTRVEELKGALNATLNLVIY